MHGARPRRFRQGHRQHFQQNAIDIVLGLRLGQAQRINLHAITEPPQFGVRNAITRGANLIPQKRERPHLADFGDEANAGIHEERQPPENRWEVFRRDFAAGFDCIEQGDRIGERHAQFLRRRRAGFLQMIRANIGRVPVGSLARAPGHNIGGDFQRRFGRENKGAARQIFFDDVILRGAAQRGALCPLFLRSNNIKRQQPGRRRIDRHRGVHLRKLDAGEKSPHVAQMGDRHADLTDFAARQHMIWIIAGLGRQIERHGKAGLAFGEIGPVKRVRLFRRRMAGIGAKQPRRVAARRRWINNGHA